MTISLTIFVSQSNSMLFRYIITFLHDIAQLSQTTLMPAENLAVCFAPNLLRCHSVSSDPQDILIANQVIQFLILNPIK
jgi:hypothetical protein